MSSRSFALVLSLLTACGASSSTMQTGTPVVGGHEIHLTRSLPVGYAWSELTQYTGTQHETIRAGNTLVSDAATNTAIELAGEYTIVALGADGQPTRLRFAVDHMTVDTGSGPAAMQLPGVIEITRGQPGTVAGENGEAIADETIELLRHCIPLDATTVDDDLVFGTRTPQAIDSRWPVDSRGAARSLAAVQLTVDPSNVSGETKLVSASNEGGIDVLELRTEIAATHIGFPGLPPGAVPQRAEFQASVDMILPVHTSIVALRQSEDTAIDIQVLVPTETGGQATVEVTRREHVQRARTPR